jgi:hypothetical protein
MFAAEAAAPATRTQTCAFALEAVLFAIEIVDITCCLPAATVIMSAFAVVAGFD